MPERIIKGQLPDGRFFTSIDGQLFVEPNFMIKPQRRTPNLMERAEVTKRQGKRHAISWEELARRLEP